MKILHTADWHLSYRQYGMKEREEDFYQAAERFTDRALEIKPDAVILAGDNFDCTKPSAEAVNRLQCCVRRMQDEGIDVLSVDGNHDWSSGNWVNVCNMWNLGNGPFEKDGIRIAGLPGMRTIPFMQKLEQLATSGLKCDVFVMHQPVAEMAGFPTDLSLMDLLPHLQTMGVRYVAMGDIHIYKEMELGGIRFVMPGSIEMNAVDEPEDKSFSVLDITDTEVKTSFEPLTTRRFVQHRIDPDNYDDLLAELDKYDKDDTLVILSYDPQLRELAKQAEEVLKNNHILHRSLALVEGRDDTLATQLTKDGFERKSINSNLKDTLLDFFEETSEEYQLIVQLLDNEDTDTVINEFIKLKGVEL